jgi:DNA-binding SARP family transcriptional activator/tetratricopeptide (TPR) repeat protein
MLQVRLLGTPEVVAAGNSIEVGPAKQRLLLAALTIDAGYPVTTETLVDRVWDDAPPSDPRNALYTYVARIRRVLEQATVQGDAEFSLLRRSGSYLLVIDTTRIDLHRFRALVDQARSGGCAAYLRASLLDEALGLWRTDALAGLPGRWAQRVREGLHQQRLGALVDWADAELELDHHQSVLSGLTSFVAQNPLVEPVAGRLMLALNAAGRCAEALDLYARTRQRICEDLGTEPGPDLRALHEALLRGTTVTPSRGPAPARPAAGAPTRTAAAAPARLLGTAAPARLLGTAAPARLLGTAAPARLLGTAAPTPAQRPAQLPPDVRGFVGRVDELAKLDELLAGSGQEPHAVTVATIAGTAGVGKTSLAVHWAHQVADQFPDGQLHLNLHGFDPDRAPVDPATAIGLLLGALGVASGRIPVGLDAMTSLLRSLVHGKRMLMVLDNANNAGQLRPLLPGSGRCFVLITSRNLLTGLVTAGAHPIILDLFTTADARQLLRRRLGAARINGEPAATDEIVSRCVGLPLSLSIVASRAAVMPRSQLADVVAELRQARNALDGFASDDAVIDLRAVFSWSYHVLSLGAARLFRLMALHPGPDVTAEAMVSLAASSDSQVSSALAELTAANLISRSASGRYGFHDLLRAYAIELTEQHEPSAEREAAMRRLLDHYVHTANPAVTLLDPRTEPTELDPPQPGVVAEDLADSDHAMAWFEAESAVLTALVVHVAGDFDPYVWRLAWSFAVYLDRSGNRQNKITIQLGALSATRRAGNRMMAALTLRSLGRTYGQLREYGEAHECVAAALDLFRELGHRDGQARALGTLAEVLEFEGRCSEALELAVQTHELYRSIGNPIGEAQALNNIGFLQARLGEYERTISSSRRALALFIEVGDRAGQGAAHDSIGFALQHLGRHREAVDCYRQALGALGKLGFRYFTAIVQDHLGDAQHSIGDTGAADDAWGNALAIFTDLEAPEASEVRTKLTGRA